MSWACQSPVPASLIRFPCLPVSLIPPRLVLNLVLDSIQGKIFIPIWLTSLLVPLASLKSTNYKPQTKKIFFKQLFRWLEKSSTSTYFTNASFTSTLFLYACENSLKRPSFSTGNVSSSCWTSCETICLIGAGWAWFWIPSIFTWIEATSLSIGFHFELLYHPGFLLCGSTEFRQLQASFPDHTFFAHTQVFVNYRFDLFNTNTKFVICIKLSWYLTETVSFVLNLYLN